MAFGPGFGPGFARGKKKRSFWNKVKEWFAGSLKDFLLGGLLLLVSLLITLLIFIIKLLVTPFYNQYLAPWIDWKLLVTLVILEVPLGIILSFLDRRRRRDERILGFIQVVQASNSFQHLEFQSIDGQIIDYVLNTRTNKAFIAPKYVSDLANEDLIQTTKFSSEKACFDALKQRNVTTEHRKATFGELR